jgi:hypothetical protein
MIDLATEQLVPLQEVPRLLPPRPSGKRVHVSAVYRWAQRGVGGLRLEAVRVGGTTYTSREALQRFARTPRDDVPPPGPPDPGRERQIQDAARRVQGLLTSPRSAGRLRDSTSPVLDRGGHTAAG